MPSQKESLKEMIARHKKAALARKAKPQLPPGEVKAQIAQLAEDLFHKVDDLRDKHDLDFDEAFEVVAENLEGVHLPGPESELLQKLVDGALGTPKKWTPGTLHDRIARQKAVSQKILEYVRRGLSEDAESSDLENIWHDVYHGSYEASEKAGWRFRHPLIKEEHAKRLIQAAEVLNQSPQSLLDEALDQYLECNVSAYVEDVTEQASKA